MRIYSLLYITQPIVNIYTHIFTKIWTGKKIKKGETKNEISLCNLAINLPPPKKKNQTLSIAE